LWFLEYARDDSDFSEFPLYDFEKGYADFVESILPGECFSIDNFVITLSYFLESFKSRIEKAFTILLGVYVLFTVLLSLLRTEFLDVHSLSLTIGH